MTRGLLALLLVGTACATPVAFHQGGHVGRAIFTTEIDDREPQDNIRELPNTYRKIYYFTELRDMAGQTVTHRWTYKGRTMAKIRFKVRGSRWRVYSSKALEPHLVGQWKASVVDSSGRTLSSGSFRYSEAGRVRRSLKSYSPAKPDSEGILGRGARRARGLYDKVFGGD